MTGKEIFTNLAGMEMPDLEAVRAKCLNRQNDDQKTEGGKIKVRKFKKMIWTIPIAAILLLSMTTAVLGATVPGVNNFIHDNISEDMANWMADRNPGMNERLERHGRPDDSNDPIESFDPTKPVMPFDPTDSSGIPAGLTASRMTADSVTLIWHAVPGATGYVIYYGEAYKNNVQSKMVTSTTCTITGLKLGTLYEFYMKAKTADGLSDASITIYESPSLVPSNESPSMIRMSAGNVTSNSCTLFWSGRPYATNYGVYQNTVLIATVPYNASNTYSYNVTNLDMGRSYQFYISPGVDGGAGSNMVSITTLTAGPNAPTGLKASNVTSNSITLSWNETPWTSDYYVYKDGVLYTSTTKTTCEISNLNPGTSYSFYLIAANGWGKSPASNTVTVTTTAVVVTPPVAPPSAPINLSAINVKSSSFQLTWMPVVGATSYEVYLNGMLYNTVSASQSFCNIYVGSESTSTCYVIAKNGNATSSPSNTISVTTPSWP